MATVSAIDILNTIRDNSTTDYISRVPSATRDNLLQVGQAITAEKNIMNDFMTMLINKIALTTVKVRMYHNPLAKLKQGNGRPLGNTIEELFVNPAKDQGYSEDSTLLLATKKADGKACYYGLNRQGDYMVTISKQALLRAFSSERSFMNFYNAQINSLYSGDQIDEFLLAKNVFSTNIDNENMKMIECDISAPKDVAKAISNVSSLFEFASTTFNGYNLVNAANITAGETKVNTFCPVQNQVLLIRADVMTEINYEVLASMFHMELAKLQAMTIKVDNFNTIQLKSDNTKRFDTYAVLCDVEALQMLDDVFETDSQYIGSSMKWNVWLHHWEWIYLSLFANCVAFGKTVAK
jgi:hypothetical protein